MKYGMVRILLILLFVSLITIPIALCSSPTSPIVYVDTDGSGDYNCDGINDHIEINKALEYVANNDDFTTVHLNGANTYWIDNSILIGNNTILEGDSDAKIKLIDNAGWATWEGMLEPLASSGDNVTIRGFEIDGNSANNPHPTDGYYLAIFMDNCDHLTVNNMYIHHTSFDGVRVQFPSFTEGVGNLNVYDNVFDHVIHDSIGCAWVDGMTVYNNTITPRTNAGIRAVYTNHVKIYNNTIDPLRITAGAAIQIQSGNSNVVMDEIEIYDNVINRANKAAIWFFGYQTSTVASTATTHIHHNTITNSGKGVNLVSNCGGIVIQGFSALIENNVLDSNYNNGIAIFENPSYPANDVGYTVTVRNNIITNTVADPDNPSTTGYGLRNYESDSHIMTSDYNNIYGNLLGNYVNVAEGTHDIHVNSLYHAPVLNSIDSRTVEVGNSLSFMVSASDADDDTLTYSATDLPSGASIDSSTGAFSWTPSDSQVSTHSVTFEVTDGQFTDSEEVTITVNGKPATAPSLVYDNRLREASPDSVYSNNDYIDIGRTTNGRFRDVMWLNLSTYNTTDTVSNATLSLYWYSPENSPRNQDTVVEVYRAADWNSDHVSWNNRADGTPWNNAGGDWSDKNDVAQGSEPYASITFDANNLPDNRYYEFDITELVQDYVSGEYENTGFFLKAQNEYDNYIAFYSSDWSNENQRPKLTITHTPETEPVNNNAPVLNSIDSRTVEVGNSLSFMVSASDADDDTLTYSATDLPSGASIDSSTGAFSWTPSDSQVSTHSVTFEVTDGQFTDSEEVTITVNAAYPRWDVNKDGIVNILDITLVGQNIGTSAESSPRCDVNQDGLINILDLTIVGQNFGKTVN